MRPIMLPIQKWREMRDVAMGTAVRHIVIGKELSENLAGIRSVVKSGRKTGALPSYLTNPKMAGN